MKIKLPLIPLILVSCISQSALAQSAAIRECNLQAREIALRASEEVFADMSAEARNRLVLIAEEVCLGNPEAMPAAASAAQPLSAPASNAAASAPVEQASAAEETGEDGGLFNFKVIDPEDRVRRPGLKRR